MTILTELLPAVAADWPPPLDPRRLAIAAHLARYRATPGRTWNPTCERCSPGAATGTSTRSVQRPQLELYVRWMQEVRRYKPSTVSRRMSVVTGFYRTRVIDGVLEHSPAEFVRRPNVPPESPTLGLTHLQLEALLIAGRGSTNPSDFALVCLLGLLGLRISRSPPSTRRGRCG